MIHKNNNLSAYSKWFTSKEAADYLRISANNLRTRVCRGQIVTYRFGNRLRFRKIDLDKLLEQNKQEVFQ
jgi:excisionase family DNA binding protein